jgi:hypothetical protein
MGSATAAPHVMVLPFPAQGHVTPLMELSHRLVERGFQVTFVSTELIHALMIKALQAAGGKKLEGIRLVSVPDGLADGDDRRDLGRFVEGGLAVCAWLSGAAHQGGGGAREGYGQVARWRRHHGDVLRGC